MTLLPPAPDELAFAPRAFYDQLRAAVEAAAPADVDPEHVELDFGDAGVAVTLPHDTQPGWTITVQCSRVAAVVFAGPTATHFDNRRPDWVEQTVAFVVGLLRGQEELELAADRGRPAERLRIDFGARG